MTFRHILAVLLNILLVAPAAAQTYNPIAWQQIDRNDPRIDALYPEAYSIKGTKLPREPRVYIAQIDHPMGLLTLSMWVGQEFCGINNCGIKIFDAAGTQLGGANTCDVPQANTIDPSNQFIRLCSDTARAVADMLWNYDPPQAANSASIWQHSDLVQLDHNGSVMTLSASEGTIRYQHVREGLRGSIADGTILFKGEPWQPGGAFSGVAYTFRKGCPPAPYPVTASYQGYEEVLTLKGEAPIRVKGGCEVIGYTADSGNAKLEFYTTFD